MVWEDETFTCRDDYRLMPIGYDGRIPFGAEVAWSLSEELKKRRPGCVEEGWDALPDTGVTCPSGAVAGVRISPGLTRRSNSVSHPEALPTGRDEQGNILLHFRAGSPGGPSGLLVSTSSARQVWAWSVLGGESGVDRRRFPECNRLLRSLVETAASGGDFGPVHALRAMDEVRAEMPAGCGSALWGVFPVLRFPPRTVPRRAART